MTLKNVFSAEDVQSNARFMPFGWKAMNYLNAICVAELRVVHRFAHLKQLRWLASESSFKNSRILWY